MHRNTHPCRSNRRLIAALLVVASLGFTTSARAADDPYIEEILHTRPAPVALVAAASAPRWGKLPETQLRVALGWTALSGFLITEMSAPSLEASLAWRFRGVSERLGLRLSAFVAGSIKARQGTDPVAGSSDSDDDASPSPLALGANLSLEINWPSGFFIAPGLGVLHYRGMRYNPYVYDAAPDCSDCGYGGSSGDNNCGYGDCRSASETDSLTLPEMTLALGWEFNISKTFALVIAAQGGFAVIAARGSLYAGAVVNF